MSMTPAECSLYQISKVQQIDDERLFIRDENRMQNFYIVKSTFGDTKKVKDPTDLYKFRFEEDAKEEDVKQLSKALTSNDELSALAKAIKGKQREVSKEELAKYIRIK